MLCSGFKEFLVSQTSVLAGHFMSICEDRSEFYLILKIVGMCACIILTIQLCQESKRERAKLF